MILQKSSNTHHLANRFIDWQYDMASTAPWSIKGIDIKTRKMVKTQAQLAGVTMGEWLSDAVNLAVIEDYQAEQIEVEQVKMAGAGKNNRQFFTNQSKQSPTETRNSIKNNQNSSKFNVHQSADIMKNTPFKAKFSHKHNHLNRPSSEYSDQVEQQLSNGFTTIETALTDIVDHIDLTDSRNSQALREMQSQISRLNERTKDQNEPDVHFFHQEFGQMAGRLAGLADRIDGLNETNSTHAEPTSSRHEPWKADPSHTHDQQFEKNNQDFEQTAMSSRFDELFIKLDNISHQQTDYNSSIKYLELGMKNQLDQVANNLSYTEQPQANDYDHEIDEIEQKLSLLSERLESRLDEPRVDPQISELEAQITDLSYKLSEVLDAPQPEYSPVPTVPMQSQESSTEISELRDDIAQINLRLEKTEDRLTGIDRLEENMSQLISSVSDMRNSSQEVAQDAATAAVEAFAQSQQPSNERDETAYQADIDDIIANKFAEISAKNDQAEKTQLSGFKTVESSLEKIMDRLSQVENNRHQVAETPAASIVPPDPIKKPTGAAQDFIQPGAETNAEQPQDITAKQAKPATANTKPETPKTPEMEVVAKPAISEPTPAVAPAAIPQPALETTPTPAMSVTPERRVLADKRVMDETHLTQERRVSGERRGQQTPRIETPTVETPTVETPTIEVAPPQVAASIGLEVADSRPTAQPSSSTDFIAAARRAAQQSYESDKDTNVESGLNQSLFTKIKQAAKRDKNQNQAQAENLTSITDEVTLAEGAITGKTKKKFSLSKFSRNKNKPAEPIALNQPDDYTADLPTDIFEDNFFNEVELPAQAALQGKAGNELSLEAKDVAATNKKLKRRSATPVVIALFLVTILLVGMGWYTLRGGSSAAKNTDMAQTVGANDNGNTAAATQATQQNSNARAILNDAKTGLSNMPSQTKPNFTPQEFENLSNGGEQARTPTAQQLETLKNDGDLVTNSIPALSGKSYTSSLLGNSNKFSKAEAAKRVGSSSLSKSIAAVDRTPTLPTAKYTAGKVTDELPTEIGPKLLRQNALIGQAAEQFEIANRYALGYGVDIDLVKSYNWFVKAADNKLAVAQFSVGMMLEHGKGTDRNLSQARQYYQYAAEQGNLMSIYRLAMMNAAPQNPTTKPDFKVALKWFSMAANAGLVDAQYNLAVLYEKGHGTEVDLVETYKWYSIAGNKGDQQAKKRAKLVKLELSASQILAAQKAVKVWKVAELPQNANIAPKLDYLKNESQKTDTKLSQSPHVKSGVLATNLIADKKAIQDAQKMLGILGWNVGKADGIMGSKTRKAITEFQTRHNLIINGEVNDELLANLEASTL